VTRVPSFLVGVDEEIEPQACARSRRERRHLAELPQCIDMEKGKRRLAGKNALYAKCPSRSNPADRIEHDRVAELRPATSRMMPIDSARAF